jgi:hypothetical protein
LDDTRGFESRQFGIAVRRFHIMGLKCEREGWMNNNDNDGDCCYYFYCSPNGMKFQTNKKLSTTITT